MRRSVLWVVLGLFCLTGAVTLVGSGTGSAADIHPEFQSTWERSDRPVAEHQTTRTWMWGPAGHSDPFSEPYIDAPGSERLVQYFDKSRMELNNPDGDPADPWHVTNGLLARELITGEMQTGDDEFQQSEPAHVQVAGDAHPESPTYATFSSVLDAPSLPEGALLVQSIDASGVTAIYHDMAVYEVTSAYYVPETSHSVASVFWDFMNATGTVYSGGHFQVDQLFENPFFAVGLPITGAYWMQVPVAGEVQNVLAQCFERRCLTYTPENPDGWQVEAGNIGQHYFEWRYGVASDPDEPPSGDVQTDDEFDDLAPPDDDALGPPVPGACEAESQAVLIHVSDSLGNVNPNSWAKGTGGDWSGGFDASPVVNAGQEITLTATASGDCPPLEYRFQRYRAGDAVEIVRDWSVSSQHSYTFQAADAGEYLIIIVDVRNQDPRTHFHGRDDYTYLTYLLR